MISSFRPGFALGVCTLIVCNMAAAQRVTVPDVPRDEVICFALYTVHDNVLKLTAQLYPLEEGEDRTLRLEIEEGGAWHQVATARVVERGWTAPFRVAPWDDSKRVRYRVTHAAGASYAGTIRKDPVDKDTVVVAAFTGNSVNPRHGGDIPKTDIIDNIRKLQPDLLCFLGDQVYNHTEHYAHWLKFGRDFGPIIRDFPTVTLPDDHDVGHPNLWGAGGKQSFVNAGHDGGYFMPVEYVKEVERAQTSHLPDPFDPTPIERGIGVYYTGLTWGGVSFAILEDRKWKSGPEGLVPQMGQRPDHIATPNYDPKSLDVPGAVLLGERQLAFLDHWAADWTGAEMKAVLSQTIFCGGAHLHGRYDGRLYADLDANGWPQTGRNKALRAIRKAFAVMIGGDQHLGSIIHHGVDAWGDAGYSISTPSIANLYLRWWAPLGPGANRGPGAPDYTGDFHDGFGNKITVWAMANPDAAPNGDKLTTRAAGFSVIKFHKPSREITFECWPRNVDFSDPNARQYPGWPKTIQQQENYGATPSGYLPTLRFTGAADPVVQVVHEDTGDIVYTLRVKGRSFQPKVFEPGAYTVHIGEAPRRKTLTGLQPAPADSERPIDIDL